MDPVPVGAACDHAAMTECCDGCGHFSCPCGVAWDEGAEGPGPFDVGFRTRIVLDDESWTKFCELAGLEPEEH